MTSEPRPRTRPLTAEEAELWASVTRDAKLLRRRRKADHGTGSVQVETGAAPEERPTAKQHCSHPKPVQSRPNVYNDATTNGASPLAAFDERQRRKLAREPHLIDARLDLHGMRKREAHSALRGFLLHSASRRHRHVLIITGKGTRAEIERSRDHFAEERGVLRRLVPQWLSEPEMRGAVLSYTTASVRHGGEGALYVRLRKFRGS